MNADSASNESLRQRVLRSIRAAWHGGVLHGMGLSWGFSIAAYSLYQVFAGGDLGQIIPFVTAIGGGLIGDTLRGWAAQNHQPSTEELVALLEEASEENKQDLLAGLKAALGPEFADLLRKLDPYPPAEPYHSLADPLSADESPILICRRPQVAQLHGWLQAVREGRPKANRLVIVTGGREAGKLDLLRTWLNEVGAQQDAPLVAIAPFLPPYIAADDQAEYYRTHAAWRLDRERYGPAILRCFPPLFKLGSYPWIVLAAQLAAGSERVRRLLTPSPAAGAQPDLHAELPPDSAELRAVLTRILHAAATERPLVVILEHVQEAGPIWLIWLKRWLAELAGAPVLFVVTADAALQLHDARLQIGENEWLRWLQARSAPASPLAELLHAGRLRRGEIEELLAPPSQDWAADLHALSAGAPAVLRELLVFWRDTGQAEQTADGRWRLHFDPGQTAPGSLELRLVKEPLRSCAERAQALGYALDEEALRQWLCLAAWEGEAFTDAVLACALDLDQQLEAVQIVLDDVLCGGEEEEGVLAELDETVQLPTAELEHPFHTLARYRIIPPILRRILLQGQEESERRSAGGRYAEALAQVYAPVLERVAAQLIAIYKAVGDLDAAQRVAADCFVPSPGDGALWDVWRALAVSNDEKLLLIQRALRDFDEGHGRLHPRVFLPGLDAAEAMAQEAGLTSLRARALNNIGGIHHNLGEMQRALGYFEQALPLLRQVGDRGGKAATLNNIGLVHHDLGEMQRALDYLEQALPLIRQVGDKEGEAATLNNIGLVHRDLGEMQRALEYYEQALPLMRQVGDKGGEAATLNGIGSVHHDLGEMQRALEYLEQALPLLRQVGDNGGEAATLHGIGNVHYALGEMQRALDYYEQALPLMRQVGDKGGEAATLTNIGNVHRALGEMQRALDYLEQALPLMRQVGDKRGEAWTLTNIGNVHHDLGEMQRALDYYEQALPLMRQVGDKGGEAWTLNGIGSVHHALGEMQRALGYLEQALTLRRQVGDRWHEADVHYDLALVHLTLGDRSRAVAELEAAVALDQELGRPELARHQAKLDEVRGP